MKKFLLSILCVLGFATMASAETYTCVMKDAVQAEDGSTTWTCGGFTFAADKLNSTTAPTINAKNGDMRIYAKSTLTITAPDAKITGLSFEISAQGLKRATDVTPSVGSIVKQGANPLVWEGDAQSVTFTVGDNAVYGSEGATKAGQFDFTAVTIYTGDDAPQIPDTPAEATHGVYTATTTINTGNYLIYAADKIATPLEATKNYGYIPVADATVVDGTITAAKANQFTITAVEGGYTIQGPDARYYYMTGTYNSFNLSAERTDGDLWTITPNNDGTVLVTNVLMEKTLQFDSNYNSYGAYPDVRGTYPTLYAFTKDAEGEVEPPVEPELPVLENLNMLYDLEKGTAFKVGIDMTVIYTSGAYTYVTDGVQNALIYQFDLGVAAGDVIASGWDATLDIYSNLYEIKPSGAVTVKSQGTMVPEPLEVEGDDVTFFVAPYNQSAYIKLMGVTFADATPAADAKGSAACTYTGKMGENDVTFYQRFGLDSVEAGTYNVVGFVAVYNQTAQVYPVSFDKVSGIENVADDNAPVKYYNIQGMPVANPQPGALYIRVQGNTATKVIR